MKLVVSIFFGLLLVGVQAQNFVNELFIPDTITGVNFSIEVKDTTKEFFPGVVSNTMAYNSNDYLGPTIIFNQNDSVNLSVTNNTQLSTTLHWHGMHVPAIYDGGPHNVIQPGATWLPTFKIYDEAATMWYHSHLHHHTRMQVNKGLAGMIIIRDDHEAALDLPRTYGVDDIPLIVQDRLFSDVGVLVDSTVHGDTVLINGTLAPTFNAPAQMVRMRLLNGSAHRVYHFGFSDERDFSIIAGDGGLIAAPYTTNRVLLTPGERMEIVVNFNGQLDSTLYLVNYASELGLGIPGGPSNIADDPQPSPINGIDLPLLEINVVAQTTNPVLSLPSTLNTIEPHLESSATVFREKQLTGGFDEFGNRIWSINNRPYSDDRIDDVVRLNDTEIWEIENVSAILHPFHIHSGHFYILSRTSGSVPEYEQGKKDVVSVFPGETIRFIMKFEDFADNENTYMYHCHLLNHEDHGMMAQFLVVDSTYFLSVQEIENNFFSIVPNPVGEHLVVDVDVNHPTIQRMVVLNATGKIVLEKKGFEQRLPIDFLPTGNYFLSLETAQGTAIKQFHKE